MIASHTIETPLNAAGAVSIIKIVADDLDPVFELLRQKPLALGQIQLRQVLNLDESLLARIGVGELLIMPHGGIGITRSLSNELVNIGIDRQSIEDPAQCFPEAQDIFEARMLLALARSPSPMCVDVLLEQPDRWRSDPEPESEADRSTLRWLLHPPQVVALGQPNIGKSTLINALAGESVAMVSDHMGTTRDHVGVLLDLAGLVVRWVDTPGVGDQIETGEELRLAARLIDSADLIVHTIDSCDTKGVLDPRLAAHINPRTPIFRLVTRSDLCGSMPECDYKCSVKTGEGMVSLATIIRDLLVGPATILDPRPWRFWDS